MMTTGTSPSKGVEVDQSPGPCDDASEPSAVEALGTFVAQAPRSYGAFEMKRASLSVADTIGCMLYGADSVETNAVLNAVRDWGEGPCPLVGRSETLPAPWAAMVNAVSAHCFDFDDWDDPSLVHTSAVTVPAILATMNETGWNAEDMLDAHIVGAEVIMRLGEALNPSHYWKGWHTTSTLGAIGATAAVCRLLKLDKAQASAAISASTSLANGYLSQFGTHMKPTHAGVAAKAGILAASLARSGISASTEVIDGPVSLMSTSSEADRTVVQKAMSKLGNPWAITEFGIHIKLYPSCGGTHRVIESALKIVREHGVQADEIVSIDINVPEFLDTLLPYRFPKNKPEALFSIAYCCAAALRWGKVGPTEFQHEAIASREIEALLSKTTITTRDTEYFDKLCIPGEEDVVTVVTRDSNGIQAGTDIPYGAPPRLADTETVRAKFMNCAISRVSDERAARIFDVVTGAGGNTGFAELPGLMGAGPGGG